MKTLHTLILGLSFIIGMFILGQFFLNARKSNQFVSVKGLAEQEVKANQGSWLIASEYNSNDLDYLKNTVNRQVEVIQDWLEKKGFADSEIKVSELGIRQNIYGNVQAKYSATLKISVSTDQVDRLDNTSGEVNELIDLGVPLSGDSWLSRPRFYFTSVNEIKPELLKNATQAALVAAEEFASNSGAKVGGIKYARQGIISLIPANRVNESEEFYLHKIARVVSSIDYYIK